MLQKIIFSVLFSSFLYAHPHTFMDVSPKIIVKNNIIKNINIKWLIDEMTSSMLIMEFDQNQNNKIDKDENNYILKNYFSSLSKYDYYIHISQKFKINNFNASIIKNRIQYSFDMILNKNINIKNFSLSFYDTDFFVSLQLKKEFITQKLPYIINDIDGDFYYGYKITYK